MQLRITIDVCDYDKQSACFSDLNQRKEIKLALNEYADEIQKYGNVERGLYGSKCQYVGCARITTVS
jgi:hypothetical protein